MVSVSVDFASRSIPDLYSSWQRTEIRQFEGICRGADDEATVLKALAVYLKPKGVGPTPRERGPS